MRRQLEIILRELELGLIDKETAINRIIILAQLIESPKE